MQYRCSCTSITSTYGGIFRNHLAEFMRGFDENIGKKTTFFDEISGALELLR
jgi:hypothetical protein